MEAFIQQYWRSQGWRPLGFFTIQQEKPRLITLPSLWWQPFAIFVLFWRAVTLWFSPTTSHWLVSSAGGQTHGQPAGIAKPISGLLCPCGVQVLGNKYFVVNIGGIPQLISLR